MSRGLRLYAWLLRDAFSQHGFKLLWVTLVGTTGAALELFAIGQAVYVAKQVEAGGQLEMFGFALSTRSKDFLLFATALVGATMLAAAGIQFMAQKLVFAVRQDHERFCAQRILEACLAPHAWKVRWPGPRRRATNRILRLLTRNARTAGNAVRIGLMMLAPAFQGAVAVVALLSINWWLTLVLTFPGLLYLWCLYHANLYNARSAAAQEDRQEKSSLYLLRTISEIHAESSEVPNLSTTKKYQLAQDAYDSRFISLEYAGLGARTFMALSVVAVMAILALQMLDGSRSWGALIIYLVALRYASNSLRHVATLVTRFNRFYPRLSRYMLALEAIETAARPTPTRGDSPVATRHRLFLSAPRGAPYLETGDILRALHDSMGIDVPEKLKWVFGDGKVPSSGFAVGVDTSPETLHRVEGSVLSISTRGADIPTGFTNAGVWEGTQLAEAAYTASSTECHSLEEELTFALEE